MLTCDANAKRVMYVSEESILGQRTIVCMCPAQYLEK